MGADSNRLTIKAKDGRLLKDEKLAKTRPDDFKNEILHLVELSSDPSKPSPLDLSVGLQVLSLAEECFKNTELFLNESG